MTSTYEIPTPIVNDSTVNSISYFFNKDKQTTTTTKT